MKSRSKAIKVMLNASHSVSGGGLIYLQGILPELARAEDIEWLLVAPAGTLAELTIPESWTRRAVPHLGFFGLHLWEQTVLPVWARRQGVTATLCNSNYVPLLAPRPIPILHSSVADGRAQAATWKERLYWAALQCVTSLSLRRCTMALTTAEYLVDDYGAGRSLRRDSRWRWTPPGVPTAPSQAVRNADLVVAVGDIHRHKDYPALVRAFALVLQRRPRTRLEIIGRAIDQTELHHLQTLVAHLGIEHSFALAGALPHDQTLMRIAQAAVLVSASLAETSSMVAIEAMAVGTPVILSDLRFQRQLAENVAVFVPASGDRAEGFASAILDVLENDAEQARMRDAGRARSLGFNWAKTASVIVDTVKRIASA